MLHRKRNGASTDGAAAAGGAGGCGAPRCPPTICSVCGRSALRLKSRSPMVRDTLSAPLMRLSLTKPPACRQRRTHRSLGVSPRAAPGKGCRACAQGSRLPSMLQHCAGWLRATVAPPLAGKGPHAGGPHPPPLAFMMRLASSKRMGLWSSVSARAWPRLDSTQRESPAGRARASVGELGRVHAGGRGMQAPRHRSTRMRPHVRPCRLPVERPGPCTRTDRARA